MIYEHRISQEELDKMTTKNVRQFNIIASLLWENNYYGIQTNLETLNKFKETLLKVDLHTIKYRKRHIVDSWKEGLLKCAIESHLKSYLYDDSYDWVRLDD